MKKERKKIYVITMIEDVEAPAPPETIGRILGHSRTVAWEPDLENARDLIEKDAEILHECYYLYAVIEGTPEGISYLGGGQEEYWYKWNDDTEEYDETEKPSCLKQIICFGIG